MKRTLILAVACCMVAIVSFTSRGVSGVDVNDYMSLSDDSVYSYCETDSVYEDSACYDEIEDEYLSPAEIYYKKKGMPNPLDSVYDYFDAGRYDLVKEITETVLREVPDDPDVWCWHGYASCKLMDYAGAIHDFAWPIRNGYYYYGDSFLPNTIDILSGFEPEATIAEFEDYANKLEKDSVCDSVAIINTNLILANAYSEKGFKKHASDKYMQKALEFMTGSADRLYCYSSMANFLCMCDLPDQALQVIERAKKEGFSEDEFAYCKFLILRNSGQGKKAEEYLLPYFRKYPENLSFRSNLIINYTIEGKYKEAIELCNQGLELIGDSDDREKDTYELIVRRAFANELAGNKEAAADDFDYILATGSDNGYYTSALAHTGRLDEIEENLSEPGTPAVTKASMYAAMGLFDKAFEYLPEAFETKKTTPGMVKWDIHLRRLVDDPRYAEALKHFKPEE